MTSLPLARFDGDLLIYGCGTMAGTMLTRWLDCGLSPDRVTAIRASGAAAPGGVTTRKSAARLAKPDILVIGLKPQIFPQAKADLARLAGPDTLVVSIMAGVELADLADALPTAGAIIRAMPNLPVASGRGVVATVGDAGKQAARFDALMQPLGHVHPLAEEAGFNLVTALIACGPAFVYRFVAALAGSAVRLGLDERDADLLARATVAGAAAGMADSGETATALADAVASPGGMTQAGLDVLDSDGRLAGLLAETLRAARDRGRELAASVQAG